MTNGFVVWLTLFANRIDSLILPLTISGLLLGTIRSDMYIDGKITSELSYNHWVLIWKVKVNRMK